MLLFFIDQSSYLVDLVLVYNAGDLMLFFWSFKFHVYEELHLLQKNMMRLEVKFYLMMRMMMDG